MLLRIAGADFAVDLGLKYSRRELHIERSWVRNPHGALCFVLEHDALIP